MNPGNGWEFTDDRGRLTAATDRPTRVVAYIQAGATLWDHGVRPLGIFGSHHDGETQDPAKAGELPLAELRSFGAGSAFDLEGVHAAGADLVVAVGYGTGQVYGIDPEAAKHLEEQIPVVVIEVGKDRSLDSIRDRFSELARSLHAPLEPAVAELERAEARLRAQAAGPVRPRVLALSAAGPETAYLARPDTWPDLRALTELGVGLIAPEEGGGANWRTVEWSEAAALAPDIVLADVRANAAPRELLQDNAHWRAIEERARIVAWNPETPSSHRAHARSLDTVTDALAAVGADAADGGQAPE
ncbi:MULTISPECIES: ABC transporter substrate-binding protein [unclassified Streptomyces]|uniref:ABC transporter substrate-binding protein n=1 Tax=unclassified Streptomyces TaxID=2593676 RepID=UPI002E78DE7A|nr:ABC transporter substrate-binding protein [Streptomyces sp. JV176]MEE1801386.1 ABC transporter substrate-binding protein [Streptomyces sp. JV176]